MLDVDLQAVVFEQSHADQRPRFDSVNCDAALVAGPTDTRDIGLKVQFIAVCQFRGGGADADEAEIMHHLGREGDVAAVSGINECAHPTAPLGGA